MEPELVTRASAEYVNNNVRVSSAAQELNHERVKPTIKHVISALISKNTCSLAIKIHYVVLDS